MYIWLVFFHVLGVFRFLIGHGASAMVSLRLRYVRGDLQQVRALLDLSMYSIYVMYVSLLLLLVTGVWATFRGRLWDEGWIWVSLVLLVAMIIAMYAIASTYYHKVRQAAGLSIIHGPRVESPPPANQEELEALLSSPRPFVLAGIGLGGLIVILYMMMFKPSLF
jgi:hypothetical protein